MDTIEQLRCATGALCDMVDRLWHQQLQLRTPSGHTVADELDQLMVLGATYTYQLRGDTAPEISPPAVYGWVPAAELREVMDDLVAAATSSGALENTVTTADGPMTGAEFVRLIVVGALLHGHELAASTGATFRPAPELTAAFDPFAAPVAA
jgi:hypothetical protein